MKIKFPGTIFLLLLIFLVQPDDAAGQRVLNEGFALRATRILHGAEATYQATYGNGNFGSLADLGNSQFIDPVLATGYKYGYVFVVTTKPFTISPHSAAEVTITATPRFYGKTGRRSFFINTSGVLRGADKGGQSATETDPEIDECPIGETCTIQRLRFLHGAEATYQATSGNGNYGTFAQLHAAGLIPQGLSTGVANGYLYTYTIIDQSPINPATFTIRAFPQQYGVTGIRSFLIATDGVMYCADKNGAPADENDPPCSQ